MSGWFARQAAQHGVAPPTRQVPQQQYMLPSQPQQYTQQQPVLPSDPLIQKQTEVSLSAALQAPLQWRNSPEASALGNCPRCGGNHFFSRGNAAPLCFGCGYNGRFEQAQQAS